MSWTEYAIARVYSQLRDKCLQEGLTEQETETLMVVGREVETYASKQRGTK